MPMTKINLFARLPNTCMRDELAYLNVSFAKSRYLREKPAELMKNIMRSDGINKIVYNWQLHFSITSIVFEEIEEIAIATCVCLCVVCVCVHNNHEIEPGQMSSLNWFRLHYPVNVPIVWLPLKGSSNVKLGGPVRWQRIQSSSSSRPFAFKNHPSEITRFWLW